MLVGLALLSTSLALASSRSQPSSVSQAPSHKVARYFVGNFESGNLRQWGYLGDAHGAVVVKSPTFDRTSRYALRCTTTNAPDSSVDGDGCYLQYGTFDAKWSAAGSDVWYRIQVLLPSGRNQAYAGRFRPSPPGGWDMFMEWHNSPCASCPGSYLSPYVGVVKRGNRASLAFRMVGGDATNPTYTYATDPRPIAYDRWFDMLVHIRWSSDASQGRAEWFVDGRRLYSRSVATLFRLPDGSESKTMLSVGHYRATETETDTVYLDGIVAGPTRASIASPPARVTPQKKRAGK
jgi:Polysaccharide lyase